METQAYFDGLAELGAMAQGTAVGGASGSAAARPPAGSYLEDSSNTVTPSFERVGQVYKVKACGCRSRFCERCCKHLGYALRGRLIDRLKTFYGVYMVSLTVDPELFKMGGVFLPELAYFYIRDKRCVARFVRRLFDAGYLKTDRYFYVVEWQKGTEFPHFHLILDTDFVPFAALCEAWNKFRPEWAGPVTSNRPGFGSLKFTKKWTNNDAERAARYVSKYLTKHPAHGYPDWVLDADYRIRRFSSSRGFWTGGQAPTDSEPWAGREDETAVEVEEGESPVEAEKPMTIRERIALCGNISNVFDVVELVNLQTGEVTTRDEFRCQIGHPVDWIAQRVEQFEAPNPYVLVVRDPLAQLRLGKLMPKYGRGAHE